MVSQKEVEAQLKRLGINHLGWGKAEMKELHHILIPGERICHCVNGTYAGGFAMLCATDQRLLLIDKKPAFLTVEDIRYDMISQVDYHARLMDATLRVHSPSAQTVEFKTIRQKRLRSLSGYMQHRVMEMRNGTGIYHSELAQQQTVQERQLPIHGLTQYIKEQAKGAVEPLQSKFTNPYPKDNPLLYKRRLSRF